MSNTPAMNLDKFLTNTLRAFIQAQVEMYLASIDAYGHSPHINGVQAKYECYCVAFATLARAFTGTELLDELPTAWQQIMEAIHEQICKDGDEFLRAYGINPEEL